MEFLAQGVPLVLGGDEFLNSQQGNNNAYCQDNKTGWLNWKKQKKETWLAEFIKIWQISAGSIRSSHQNIRWN